MMFKLPLLVVAIDLSPNTYGNKENKDRKLIGQNINSTMKSTLSPLKKKTQKALLQLKLLILSMVPNEF